MQSTNISDDKTRKTRQRLARASVGLFLIATVSLIIYALAFTSNPDLSLVAFQVAQPALLLGIAFAGASWNISRTHSKSTAVRIIAKISSAIDAITAALAVAMIVLSIIGVDSGYENCDHSYVDNLYSQGYMQCIENADNFMVTFYKITFVVTILAVAGEVTGRYLAYKPTKKLTNITRWVTIGLTTFLSLAMIFYLLSGIPFEGSITYITIYAFMFCLLAIVVTPILLRVEKKYTKSATLPAQEPITPAQEPTVSPTASAKPLDTPPKVSFDETSPIPVPTTSGPAPTPTSTPTPSTDAE